MNITTCCRTNICTECYLQVRPQTTRGNGAKKSSPVPCPFCNSVCHRKSFQVQVVSVTSKDQLEQQEQEQQLAHYKRLQADQQRSAPNDSDENNDQNTTATLSNTAAQPKGTTFGTCLEQDERVALFRKRSESVSSSSGGLEKPQSEVEVIQSIAMTPEQRKQLEREMKDQQLHPLALQVEMEAHQRRAMNEQRHYLQQHQQRRYQHQRPSSFALGDWSGIGYGSGSDSDIDEIWGDRTSTVAENRSNRRLGGAEETSNGGTSMNVAENRSNESRQGENMWNRLGGANETSSSSVGGTSMDVAENRTNGSRRGENRWNRLGGAGVSSGDDLLALEEVFLALQREHRRHLLPTGHQPQHIQNDQQRSVSNAIAASAAAGGGFGPRRTIGFGESHVDTFTWLMQGISEEEQLAIAIAASLQDQQQQQQQQQERLPQIRSADSGDEDDEEVEEEEEGDGHASNIANGQSDGDGDGILSNGGNVEEEEVETATIDHGGNVEAEGEVEATTIDHGGNVKEEEDVEAASIDHGGNVEEEEEVEAASIDHGGNIEEAEEEVEAATIDHGGNVEQVVEAATVDHGGNVEEEEEVEAATIDHSAIAVEEEANLDIPVSRSEMDSGGDRQDNLVVNQAGKENDTAVEHEVPMDSGDSVDGSPASGVPGVE